MRASGFRTLVCCVVSGAGLWTVAAGLLMHRPGVATVGGAIALAGAALVFLTPSQGRD